MQISHELTPQLMKDGFGEYNDYDFILPRFWKNDEEYKDYYQKSKKFKILDNGLFEGDTFTNTQLVEIINEVQPDIFISPDAWNDSNETYKKAKYWKNIISAQLPEKTKLMVVMQGNIYGDFENLYQQCEDLGYRYFAFNHSSRAYGLNGSHTNHLVNQMWGRISLIHFLKSTQYIKPNHYIHLLGCSLPQEFMYYEDIKIDSVDTSNPIVCGAQSISYTQGGLLIKPKNKIEEYFNVDLSYQYDEIQDNISYFRTFCT